MLCIGQEDRPFYYYGDQKIYLTPSTSTVAAKIQPSLSTTYQTKYTTLSNYFRALDPSGSRPDLRILVSKNDASSTKATAALSTGLEAKEIFKVPVYKIGKITLVVQNEMIVQFKPDTTENTREALLKKFSNNYRHIDGTPEKYLVTLGNPESTLRVSNTLHDNHSVEYAQPNFLSIVAPIEGTHWNAPDVPENSPGPLDASPGNVSVAPSDPLFRRQWNLDNHFGNAQDGKASADISIIKAWNKTMGSDQIRVAVLDEGVDINHPDLVNSFAMQDGKVVQWDAILESDSQQPAATESHGTRVAGVIAATANNHIGIAGVAPGVRIIPIRMGSREDSADGVWTTPLIVDQAIRKAIQLGADVINASWQMSKADVVDGAIQYAATKGRNGKGTVVVCAAGNDGGPVVYPAQLASKFPIIAVGATNSWDDVKTRDSKDKETFWASNMGSELTVVAPGVGIVTTTNHSVGGDSNNDYVYDFDGTSSAAPQVAGVAALVLSVHPDWTAARVREHIANTATKLGTGQHSDQWGFGRVNACRAVEALNCN
jgi:hypothetical protein